MVSAVRDGVHMAVSVSDHGRGIPAELLPELFRKFSRANLADTPAGVDGSGLGLAICKGIVEAHGGRIRAESDGPGLRARFTFTLPAVEQAIAAPAAATPARSRRQARGRLRVLARDLLLQRVWGPERVGEGWLLRDVVKRLRRRLGDDAADPRYIITEPRVGYRMAAEEADSQQAGAE